MSLPSSSTFSLFSGVYCIIHDVNEVCGSVRSTVTSEGVFRVCLSCELIASNYHNVCNRADACYFVHVLFIFLERPRAVFILRLLLFRRWFICPCFAHVCPDLFWIIIEVYVLRITRAVTFLWIAIKVDTYKAIYRSLFGVIAIKLRPMSFL